MLPGSSVRIIFCCHCKFFGGAGFAVGMMLELEQTPYTPHFPIYRSHTKLVNHQTLMPPTLERNNHDSLHAVTILGLLYPKHNTTLQPVAASEHLFSLPLGLSADCPRPSPTSQLLDLSFPLISVHCALDLLLSIHSINPRPYQPPTIRQLQ